MCYLLELRGQERSQKHTGLKCSRRLMLLKELAESGKKDQQGQGKKRNKHNGQGKKKQALYASHEEAALAEYLHDQKEADPEYESD